MIEIESSGQLQPNSPNGCEGEVQPYV